MTNEEAIKIIELAIAEVEWNYPVDYAAAFDKAIEALRNDSHYGECQGCVPNTSCDECCRWDKHADCYNNYDNSLINSKRDGFIVVDLLKKKELG